MVGIDAEIRNVAAEGAQPDLGIGVKITLAEFEEPAEGAHQVDAALHGLAGERVESNIDTAIGDR